MIFTQNIGEVSQLFVCVAIVLGTENISRFLWYQSKKLTEIVNNIISSTDGFLSKNLRCILRCYRIVHRSVNL